MSPAHGRPKAGSLPPGGTARSAKGAHIRPAHGRPKAGSLPPDGTARGAKGAHIPLLAVTDLAKAFGGVRAVDGVSFAVDAGRMLALIGPNGAGKTTCFNLVNGQLRPDRGSVALAGADIAGQPPRAIWRAGVGRTFQIPATFASMTVRENLQLALASHAGAAMRFWPPLRRLYRERALELLEQVGMAAQAERRCGVLAYGDVKRVELAIALAGEPRVLLMDEPTAGMASDERHALMALTRRLVDERGLAVLFTEHSLDVVFAHADTIAVMARGRLIAHGAPRDIRDDPAVREAYLGTAMGEDTA